MKKWLIVVRQPAVLLAARALAIALLGALAEALPPEGPVAAALRLASKLFG